MKTNNLFKWTAGAALALALGAGTALAQPGKQCDPADRFQAMDTNGDGQISQEEFQSADRMRGKRGFEGRRGERGSQDGFRGPRHGRMGDPAERFKKDDANQDGKVSKEEFEAAHPNAPEGAFANIDANGDGAITPDERPKHRPTHGEFGRHHARGDKRGPGGEAGDDRGEWRGPRDGRGPRGPHDGGLREADTNDDRQVTYEEAVAYQPKMTQEEFDARDRNGDGVLNREDRPERPRGGEFRGPHGEGRGGR